MGQAHSYWMRTIGADHNVKVSDPAQTEFEIGPMPEYTPKEDETPLEFGTRVHDEQERLFPAMPTSIAPSPQAEPLQDLLKRERQHLEYLIASHRPQELVNGVYKCRCQRDYENREAWAKHVRIRIERYITNTFGGDGDEVNSQQGDGEQA
jgi:hypothetical protein